MKLNPSKCSFGVSSGKFLGYIATHRGIEANPEQVRAIQVIPSPRNVKEVQRLTGRMAALSRFISRLSDKSHAFFETLKDPKDFLWTEKCEQAMSDLKAYLTTPPLLSKPLEGEVLLLYLVISEHAVSAVLVREEGRKQHPIYYVSKSLLDAETRYSHLEKLALALVNAARKLRPNFQAHQIVVVTSFPIKAVLHKPEVSGRLAKWAIELGEYDVIFRHATAIKSQVKLRDSEGEKGEWTLYVDGSSNVRGAGVGLVLTSPTGESASKAVRCNFKATNNEAEYEALIAGLTLAKQMGVEDIQVFSDSQLIISQVQGDYQAKDLSMVRYLSVAKRLLDRFRHCKLTQIPREHNSKADALANLGSALETTSHMSIALLVLQWPATEKETKPEEIFVVDEGETWMTPIINYLMYDTLPKDRDKSRKIRRQAARYCFSEGKLYRRSFSGPYLRCLTPREAARILQELHEGECGSHSSGRSLVLRARRAGYYWPTMARDSLKQAKLCRKFPMAPGQKIFLLVVTEYFTKWVEAEALAKITDLQIRKFLWTNVITCFETPHEIVTDNKPQFTSYNFRKFCKDWNIKLSYSAPRHPQSNGQAESTNKTVVNMLKKRLEDAHARWAEELHRVLWAYRTTPKTAT
ncbi:uncharacterized protein LOC130498094 [Raphanus sativus]|uniref:Uncharacterized protein LOC130498094 n=1 Tax=Raphanus sativus TaxID=3726 RepID=A0A9W3C7H7_RAPSA|nr:uncharacterized protein LOC130498094 [Raphanus sativus]